MLGAQSLWPKDWCSNSQVIRTNLRQWSSPPLASTQMLTLTAISASTSSRRSGPLCMRYCTKMLTIVSLNMKLLRCGPFFSPSSPCWVSSWFYLIKHRFYMKWIEPFQVNRTMKVLWTPTPQNCGQIRWLQNTLIYYKLDLQTGFRYIDTVSHFGLFTGSVQKVLAREVWKRPESCWGVAPATFRKNWNHLVEKKPSKLSTFWVKSSANRVKVKRANPE